MKTILSFIAFALLFLSAKSQHCPFCGSSIYVLEISDAENGDIIPGLTIYYLDSNKNAVGFQEYDYQTATYKLDTMFGWQNPKRNSFHGVIDNNHPFEAQKFRFWFANDGYIIFDHYLAKYVVIEDRRKGKVNERFKREIIDLEDMQLFRLCNHFSNWDLGESYGTPKGYSPTFVALKKKALKVKSK